MAKWRSAIFGAFLALAAVGAHAQTCNATLNPGNNLTQAVESALDGHTICLNPGTYNPSGTAAYVNDGSFAISRPVTIIGLGANPSAVVLRAGDSNPGYAVKFFKYGGFPLPNNATLANLTIANGQGGIHVFDFQNGSRLFGITLKDIVINNRTPTSNFHGILIQQSDRIVMDNVTVTSTQTAFNLLDSNESLLMNSRVTRTSAAGLSVIGGSKNVIVNNTIGDPKTGSTYSFPGGNVVFYNTTANRFENNTVQGHTFDGVDWHALDSGTATAFGLTGPAVNQSSTDNYAGKNRVISTGLADGLPGGSGMWANCSANNTWMYGNDVDGAVECAVCVWNSRSNMLLGNRLHNHGITGIFASGGNETLGDCQVPGFQLTPRANYFQSNDIFFNRNDQVTVRNSNSFEISRNYLAPSNGFGGPLQQCLSADLCQAAFAFDTDGGTGTVGAGNHRLAANTSHDNRRGFWTHPDTSTGGLQLYLNRIFNERFSRYIVAGVTNIDGGPNIGGNFWSEHDVSGNPSNGGTPFAGIIDSGGSPTVGNVRDRYPYQTEDLGRGFGVTVFEPRAGSRFAQGTLRTVRWDAPGCTMVDILLDGSTSLLANGGNTGYAVVTIPAGASIGAHTMMVRCKDSAGNAKGQASSGSFNVTSSVLQLLAPGRDDVFNAGSQIWVAWKKSAAVGSVSVQLSTNGGATFPTTLFTSSTATAARVTLPAGAAVGNAMIRVVGAANEEDWTDGVFAIRGTGFGFTNVGAGRTFVMGQLERLEWTSPANSRVATITASINGGAPIAVATDLPDRGFFDWVVPDLGTPGNIVLSLRFEQTDAVTLINNASSNTGVTRRAATVTFSPLVTLAPGASQGISATSNTGQVVAISSLTPGVCTVASGTVNAVAEGTCTIAGTTPATATYAASGQVTTSFLVSSNPGRLGNISTRMQVLTGNDVMIAGFVISGGSKTVVVRARGPSLVPFGIANALPNPQLQLVRSSDQATLAFNNDWQSAPNAAAITASGFAPDNNLEAAILMNLAPGAYTAIVSGVGPTGVGIVEVFEVDNFTVPLANISTRGQVLTGNDVMIAGFVIQGSGPQTVVIRARGPSLIPFGITNALANPQLQLVRSSDQATLATNDDWASAGNMGAILSSGFAPDNSLESAILVTLNPGAYTAIVTGVGGTTGVGIVEVFRLQ